MIMLPSNSWQSFLKLESQKPYFSEICHFLSQEKKLNKTIYPSESEQFSAYELTPLENIKVVILGQDPYHGVNQANGLAFSVHKGIAIPPSLRNIYKELESDINGFIAPNHGSLTAWAQQGVFLLNTALTVEATKAGSHSNIGWQNLTDATIREINDHCENVVFILWGSHAQKKRPFINEDKHHILASAHPSPLSSYRGFFGSKPFSKANQYLNEHGKESINWQISN